MGVNLELHLIMPLWSNLCYQHIFFEIIASVYRHFVSNNNNAINNSYTNTEVERE